MSFNPRRSVIRETLVRYLVLGVDSGNLGCMICLQSSPCQSTKLCQLVKIAEEDDYHCKPPVLLKHAYKGYEVTPFVETVYIAPCPVKFLVPYNFAKHLMLHMSGRRLEVVHNDFDDLLYRGSLTSNVCENVAER